jgi:dTDP-4-amino-4,6-dideoxygalactose transaminase
MGWSDLAAGIGAQLAGPGAVKRLETELASHFGVRHCFLVGSGKAALAVILLALKDLHPNRDEIVVPAYTCYSVPSSVLRAGLKVRLCDLGPDGLDLDPAQLSAALAGSERILAVVPTHLYGIAADVARVRQLVGQRPVAIVEDAAQAMGEATGSGLLGTLGDAGFFSLGRGKAFSTVEGGVIVTNRDDLAAALRARVDALPGYGSWALIALAAKAAALVALLHPLLFWIPRSLPFLRLGETLFEPGFPLRRLSAFQAGLARNWQRRLEAMQAIRRRNAQRWLDVLKDLGEREPRIARAACPAAVRFPLRVRDAERRAALLRESAHDGAGIAPGYPQPLNRLAELRDAVPAQDCPAAERTARELVTLPTHGYVAEGDIERVRRLLHRTFAADHAAAAQTRAHDSRTHRA